MKEASDSSSIQRPGVKLGILKFDLTGNKYGRLTVISRAPNKMRPNGSSSIMWHCICECGTKKIVIGAELKNGGTQSCGCQMKEMAAAARRTHGMSQSTEYKIYRIMMDRCTVATCRDFKNYGARGITVCPRWSESFENFFADMGKRPKARSLDRKDNNQGYSPENCRWATSTQQSRNKRTNHLVTVNGETKCVAEWAEIAGIKYYTVLSRLRYGWNPQKAVTKPANRYTYNAHS